MADGIIDGAKTHEDQVLILRATNCTPSVRALALKWLRRQGGSGGVTAPDPPAPEAAQPVSPLRSRLLPLVADVLPDIAPSVGPALVACIADRISDDILLLDLSRGSGTLEDKIASLNRQVKLPYAAALAHSILLADDVTYCRSISNPSES